jgi:hypothetical protein
MRLSRFILLVALLVTGIEIPAAAQQNSATSYQSYLPLITRLRDPNNLDLTTATYVGGAAADAATAIEIANDGTLIIGGSFPTYTPTGNATITSLPNATSGAVLRLQSDGQQILSLTRIGASVVDLELADDGRIGICGDFGAALLTADGSSAIWNIAVSSASRCATAPDGSMAILAGKSVVLYNTTGTLLSTIAISDTPTDLVLDSVHGIVVVSGWRQVTSNLQHPFLRAYGYDGVARWTSYDFPTAIANLGADTRAERIARGKDGKLYAAFSINGGTGASVLARDPKDSAISAVSRTVVTDKYTNPFNIGSVKMAWYGRFDPVNGNLELGQSLLTRLTTTDRGNSISIKAISADEQGQVVLTGDTACCIANRTNLKVTDVVLGSYESGEAFVYTTSADFRTRMAWTAFAASGTSAGGSPGTAIAARNGKVALVATLNQNGAATRRLLTYQAIQPNLGSSTLSEGYLVVFAGP